MSSRFVRANFSVRLPLVLLSGSRALSFAWAVLVVGLFGGCKHLPPSSSSPAVSSFKPLETFDAAWRIINDSYFDTNFHGLNWVAVRDELRPKAERAKDNEALREIIDNMLDRLGQSHMTVIPRELAAKVEPRPSSARRKKPGATRDSKKASDKTAAASAGEEGKPEGDGVVGFDLRFLEGSLVVFRVEAGSPGEAAGIRPGWELIRIEGDAVRNQSKQITKKLKAREAAFHGWRMAMGRLRGPVGSVVHLEFRDGENREVKKDLVRVKPSGQLSELGNLPKMYATFQSRELTTDHGRHVGVIGFNLWMLPVMSEIDRAVDRFRHDDAIIIDLRGNVGGIGGMIMGVSGHFLTNQVSLGTMKMRVAELHFLANPRWVNPDGKRVRPFGGKLAILIDPLSLSASEIFAGGMQDIGRAQVFGELTGGQALPAFFDRLPNGDILYHAIADYTTPSGIRLEGRGVRPDTTVPLVRTDLLAGKDAALEAALRWVDSGQ